MNLSNFAHIGLSLLMQVIISVTAFCFGVSLFESSVMGCFFALGFYLGREVTQAERKAGTPPWWSGFKFNLWSKDAILDLLCPAGACILFCFICFFL